MHDKKDSKLVCDFIQLLKKKKSEKQKKWAKPQAVRDKCLHYGEKPLKDHLVN